MSEVSLSEFEGPLTELRQQCASKESGRSRFEEFKLWLKGATSGLLEFVTTTTTSAVKRFAVADVLGCTGLNIDGLPIALLGDNFKAQFGNTVEENIPASELLVSRLTRYADAIEIAGAVPREKRAVRISQVYQLVLNQERTGSGLLLTNGWANLFLAYGADGNIWVVFIRRYSDGWYFYANPLGGPVRWFDGSQVFSRK